MTSNNDGGVGGEAENDVQNKSLFRHATLFHHFASRYKETAAAAAAEDDYFKPTIVDVYNNPQRNRRQQQQALHLFLKYTILSVNVMSWVGHAYQLLLQ